MSECVVVVLFVFELVVEEEEMEWLMVVINLIIFV